MLGSATISPWHTVSTVNAVNRAPQSGAAAYSIPATQTTVIRATASGAPADFRCSVPQNTFAVDTLYLIKILVTTPQTISYVYCDVPTGSRVAASTGTFYSSARTLLSGSSDVGTSFANAGPSLAMTLTTPQSLAAGAHEWERELT